MICIRRYSFHELSSTIIRRPIQQSTRVQNSLPSNPGATPTMPYEDNIGIVWYLLFVDCVQLLTKKKRKKENRWHPIPIYPPSWHTTFFQRSSNIHNIHLTLYERWNNVVCHLASHFQGHSVGNCAYIMLCMVKDLLQNSWNFAKPT